MAFTTTDLIDDIERRTFAPIRQETFDDPAILSLADDELMTELLPLLQGLRAGYLVWLIDVPIVAGVVAYDIHVRSVGLQLREVKRVTATGAIIDLPQIEVEDVTIPSTQPGNPTRYWLRGNQIVLDRVPSASGETLRQFIFLKPGKFVATDAAAIISAIDTVTGVVTVNAVPSTWSTSDTLDLIRKDGGHEPREIDLAISATSSTTLTFDPDDLPDTLALGDYVALAGQSPLVQLPDELRPVLAQAVAVRIDESMNLPGTEAAQKKLDRMLKQAQLLLTPRVHGAAKKVVSRTRWIR